jgi:CheY-like chemotaxis protein
MNDWGLVSTLPSPALTSESSETLLKTPHRSASANHKHRRVLIIEDEPAVRNVLYVLLAGVGCEGDVAHTDRQALEMVTREDFDAVLLDLRCCSLPPERVVSDMRRIRPNLVGRVLVINGEVADPQTLDLVEQLCIPHVPRGRVIQEIWGHLRRVLGLL